MIFDMMSISDLMSFGRVNENFLNIVELELFYRFRNQVFLNMPSSSPVPIKDIAGQDGIIQVFDMQTATEMLKQYGHLIQKLKIGSKNSLEINLSFREAIIKLIDEKCTKTLIELNLEQNYFPNLLANFTRPFDKLEILTLNSLCIHFSNNHLELGDLFPVLRRLNVIADVLRNTKLKSMKIPSLKHLNIGALSNIYPNVEKSMTLKIIKANPQIDSLALRGVSAKLLQDVSNEMAKPGRKLEILQITNFCDGSEFIDEGFEPKAYQFHFEHVKIFRISGNFLLQSIPSNLTFGDCLEEFEVESNPNDGKYIDFVENNKNLKIFRTIGDDSLTNHDILRLSRANLSLIDVTLICGQEIEYKNIIELMENNKQLQKLQLSIIDEDFYIQELMMKLEKNIKDEWEIERIFSEIFLTRKHFDDINR